MQTLMAWSPLTLTQIHSIGDTLKYYSVRVNRNLLWMTVASPCLFFSVALANVKILVFQVGVQSRAWDLLENNDLKLESGCRLALNVDFACFQDL